MHAVYETMLHYMTQVYIKHQKQPENIKHWVHVVIKALNYILGTLMR